MKHTRQQQEAAKAFTEAIILLGVIAMTIYAMFFG